MVQIIDQAAPRQSFSSQLGLILGRGAAEGLAGGLQQGQESKRLKAQQQIQHLQGEQENEALKRMGIDLSGITSPDIRKSIITEQLKSGGMQKEKMQPLHSGLQTIEEMRKIGEHGNLGRGSAIKGFFGGDTAKHRAQYEQLGKSLISLSSNIPIRNKAEFEALAHNLYDPSLPDDAREGILNAMESIIKRSLGGGEELSEVQGLSAPAQGKQKAKRPLSSFGD